MFDVELLKWEECRELSEFYKMTMVSSFSYNCGDALTAQQKKKEFKFIIANQHTGNDKIMRSGAIGLYTQCCFGQKNSLVIEVICIFTGGKKEL